MMPVQLWGTSFHQPVAVGVDVQKRNPFYYVDSYEHDDYPPAHDLLVLPDFKQGAIDQGIHYIDQPENEQSILFGSAGSSQLPSSDENQQHDDIDIGNDDEAPQIDPVPRMPSIAAFNNSVKESLRRKKDRVSEEECLELLQMMYYVQRPANVRVTQRPRFFTNQDIAKTVMRYYNKYISTHNELHAFPIHFGSLLLQKAKLFTHLAIKSDHNKLWNAQFPMRFGLRLPARLQVEVLVSN
ncbi:hypothetical protein BC940DRAFT_364337 [Gongronella butleri]|nr:hypothetical protein BC940DRAFT_364337 [Gongronella butleri]